jgi:hypothetical protein
MVNVVDVDDTDFPPGVPNSSTREIEIDILR